MKNSPPTLPGTDLTYSQEELKNIVSAVFALENAPSYYGKNALLKLWKGEILNQMLVNQPDLAHLHERFKNKVEAGPSGFEIFAATFKGRVHIKTLNFVILERNFAHNTDVTSALGITKIPSRRVGIHKVACRKDPQFLNDLVAHVKENHTQSHSMLLGSYVEILMDPSLPKPQSTSILVENFRYFNLPTTLKAQKEKLNAYVNAYSAAYPPDATLYAIIMADMKDIFSKNAVLENHWEELLKDFPMAVQQAHASSQVPLSMFEERQCHFYEFCLNPQYIIKNFRVSEEKAQAFIKDVNKALFQVMLQHFGVEYEQDTRTKVVLTTPSKATCEKFKGFCHHLSANLKNIINLYDFTTAHHLKAPSLNDYLEKMYSAYEMERLLPEKSDTVPAQRPKI